ncbi:MAG: HEAT repeat domain-containing protein [Opitutaceae bacterium]|nr:HEAT repeat domain-containing protein [Opitutaceae bacterium]
MNCLTALRAALLAAAVCSAPFLLAAEADSDDASAKSPRRIKDIGSRQAAPEIAAASDEAAQAIKRMKVPDGLEIKLWAAEPMLANPVAFNFDEQGRIFVAETYRYRTSVLDIRDYMWFLEDDLSSRTIEQRTQLVRRRFGAEGEKELGIEGEVLRLVEDTNGDGVADRSSVYAGGFNAPLDGIASGVLARRGQVWFTNIPSVWKFTGKAKADTRTEISRGYGVRFNYTGHDLHGLIMGPDGRLYFSNGDRGATVKTKEGGVISVPDEGAVFRCLPDGSQMELVATGLRNPQSLVFNEFGDLLTGDNDSDQGDEERLVHVVEGGDSGWRIGYQFAPLQKAGPWNSERLWHQRHDGQAAYLLPPICNIEDGPSGIDYYPGTGLNPSYRGHLFITHFKGSIARSGVYTYTLKPKGASYEIGDSKPFMTSALPTDVKFGPDGRLYTSDWGDGWPKSKRGRIYAVSDPKQANDPLIKETQQLIAGDWTKRSTAELAALLGHADWRVRLEAQFTLAERGAASIAPLAAAASPGSAATPGRNSAYARRHALWALGQIAATDKAALVPVRAVLRDADAEVRAQAVKVLGDQRVAGDVPALIAALGDASDRVKFFAAQGLGKLTAGRPELAATAGPALIAALKANDNADAYLRHALVMGLAGGNHLPTLAAAGSDASSAVRLGALLALRRLKSADVAKFLSDRDPYLVREAALAINDAPVNDAMPALAALIAQPLTDEAVGLRVINANFRLGQPANATALAAYAIRAEAPAKVRAEAIAQLALWPKPPQRDRIVGIFRPVAATGSTGMAATRDRATAVNALQPILGRLLEPASPAAVQTAALKALQELEIAGATDALVAAVRDETLAGDTRAAALGALDKIKDPRLAEAVKYAGASTSSALRLAALPIAARISPETAAPVLANLIAKGTVEEQKSALRSLWNFRHASGNALVADQLELLVAGKANPAVQLEILNAAERRTSDPRIKALLAQRESTLAAASDPLARYRVALAGGDAGRGEQIFRNQPVLACIRCHRAGADGGDAGPNLVDTGAKNSREYLLEAIIKPNATIAPGFDTIVVTLQSGSVVAGVVAGETADTLSLRNTDNQVVAVKKSEIAKREGAPSGMPEIYATLLSLRELRDVVEYMASLKGGPPRADDSLPRALRGLPPPPRITE